MKKVIFVFKCFAVLFPLLCIVTYTKNNMMAFIDGEAPYYIWNKDVCNMTHENEMDVVILGDSVANSSFMPEILSDKTVNLSLGGTTPIENYYIMQDWMDNNGAPKHVFISFMDSHFIEAECYWKRCLYSHRFTTKQNWEILKNAKKYKESSIATETCDMDFLSYEMYLPNKYVTALGNAGFDQRLKGNQSIYNSNYLYGGRYIGRTVEVGELLPTEYSEFRVKPMFDKYYKDLIRMCIDRGCEVHIVKPPLPETTTFTENYVRQYEEYYDELQKLFPMITVEWWRQGYDAACFADNSHMNMSGAFRFGQEIKDAYPQVFDEGCPQERMKAINATIESEKILGEMLKWGTLPPYALVVYDAEGDFDEIYGESYWKDRLEIKQHILTDESDSAIYAIGSAEGSDWFGEIYLKDGAYEICLGENVKYEWSPCRTSGISVLVVTENGETVVTEKTFNCEESIYTLQENE